MPFDGNERFYDPPPPPEREVPPSGGLFSEIFLLGLFLAVGLLGVVVVLDGAARHNPGQMVSGGALLVAVLFLSLREMGRFFDFECHKRLVDDANHSNRPAREEGGR